MDYCVKEYFDCNVTKSDGSIDIFECDPRTGCPNVHEDDGVLLCDDGNSPHNSPQTYRPCQPKYGTLCQDGSECREDGTCTDPSDNTVCGGFKCANDTSLTCAANGAEAPASCTATDVCYDGTECEYDTNPSYRKTTWDVIGEQCKAEIKTFKEGTFDVFIRRERDLASGPILDEAENCEGGNGEPDRDANGDIMRDPTTDARVGLDWVNDRQTERIAGDDVSLA